MFSSWSRTTPGDVLLTREAFEDHHLGLQLHVAGDGDAVPAPHR
jgi:hypothetical protein